VSTMPILSEPIDRIPEPAPHEGSLHGVRVILVDDESDGRELLADVLSTHGADVHLCESAEEARAALRERRPHLIISDIGMPRESGIDLMRSIRSMAPEAGGSVPAIAVTGYDQDSLRSETISAGYDRHVAKPVDPAALVTLATALLAGPAAGPVERNPPGEIRPV
jgi:CheY-like chemotaxis protein